MNIAQALGQAAAGGLERLDAHLLLLQALGRPGSDRAWLLAHDEHELAPVAAGRFHALCMRRAAGEPVAYLVGHKEFFGLDLAVDARVLVPRPETEVLVDWGLEVLQGLAAPRVIDLGTGSGAIALAIASRRPDARVEAVDASAQALEVARANGLRHRLGIALRQAHWLDGSTGPYELIASNPPYIQEDDHHLSALSHEPRSALASGPDGLEALREIAAAAPARLSAGGWLLLEHGWDQAAAVRALLHEAGLVDIGSRRDLAGTERCSGGRRPERG